jgi:hypothetical protein
MANRANFHTRQRSHAAELSTASFLAMATLAMATLLAATPPASAQSDPGGTQSNAAPATIEFDHEVIRALLQNLTDDSSISRRNTIGDGRNSAFGICFTRRNPCKRFTTASTRGKRS